MELSVIFLGVSYGQGCMSPKIVQPRFCLLLMLRHLLCGDDSAIQTAA